MKLNLAFWVGVVWVGVVLSAPAATLYVSLTSTNPTPPYADWSTAATNIQDAVDASSSSDWVWVTNGVYQFGGRLVSSASNRVAVTKAVTVASVNGPQATVILGTTGGGNRSSVRCAYLTNGATLAGFTLTNGVFPAGQFAGAVPSRGGGVFCQSVAAMLTNCIITAN
ncbi:MAG TPA: hypothetical protein VH598_05785, partial [Verrucomicrobiae bacterium]|nr:hypothetical protein [Verrucomicrobiae bacterium]